MKKYLISIEKDDSPRLVDFFLQPTFQKSQTEFKKIGVRGADLPTAEYFRLAVVGNKRALSPAELGCSLSHITALKDFLESEEKYACIFEDDAQCLNDDLDLDILELNIIALNLNPRFLLSLGGIQLESNRKVRGQFLDGVLDNKAVLDIHPIYWRHFFYAYAYVVDREMAKILLTYHEKPRCYDSWARIYDLDENIKFYATYLFDHPEISDELLEKSYLEKERRLLSQNNLHSKKPLFIRWKNSIMKRILNLILSKY